ncbi:MAG: enoyl-CoA hydratase [Rhodobacterales bacterium]|nr:MAG: enoyl-CoA hydratase [Rhodobacterales bacterium]
MAEQILIREDRGAVARLTLNSPGSLNALSEEMLAALAGAFAALAEDRNVRAVVIAGAGKVFCAGHDLKQMQAARAASADGGRAYYGDLFRRCGAVMQAIRALPQPVIAEVHGIATAAGLQLAASCDMVVAAEGTRFGINGVNLGLFCSTPAVALTRAVPAKLAFEMAVTGEFIDTARAREAGLVNRVVAPEALEAETMALAELAASKLGVAVTLGKAGFYAQLGQPLAEAYDVAGAVMVDNMMEPDTAEGIQAFIGKRAPGWRQ